MVWVLGYCQGSGSWGSGVLVSGELGFEVLDSGVLSYWFRVLGYCKGSGLIIPLSKGGEWTWKVCRGRGGSTCARAQSWKMGRVGHPTAGYQNDQAADRYFT